MEIKVQDTAYTPAAAQTTRTAPAAAEEKKDDVVSAGQDSVTLGNTAEKPVTYTPPKKLSSEQVDTIREAMADSQMRMLEAMAGNSINQANSWLMTTGQKYGNISLEHFGLPDLATDPTGAKAAISEGGAYSVDAVATRIFDMAKTMAGDDPEKLEQMRTAVKKGFEAAGVDFKRAVGQGLPSICNDTYDEVMQRFDDRLAELNGTAKAE